MKRLYFAVFILLASLAASGQSVAINTDGSVADGSAALDIKAINKGLLMPRVTQAQRDAISNPATGLLLYQTDNSPGFYSYNGSSWTPVGANALPPGTIVLSETQHDPALENNGFSYNGYLNSAIDGQEQPLTIQPLTWYAVNETEPDNASAPTCGKYWGPFWDGSSVFGVSFTSVYHYDFATDKYSYNELTPPTFFTSNFLNPVYTDVKQCGDYILVYGIAGSYSAPVMIGYKYHVPTSTWSKINVTNIPSARVYATAVSTGSQLIVWGGQDIANNYLLNGGIYNPVADSWTTIANPNPLLGVNGRVAASAVWTGTQLFVWGGYRQQDGVSSTTHCENRNYIIYTYYNDWFKYTPSTGVYNHIIPNTLAPRGYHATAWTGTDMVIWGGSSQSETVEAVHYQDYTQTPPVDYWECSSNYQAPVYKSGATYNLSSNTWTYMNPPAAVPNAAHPVMVWTGTDVIAFDKGGNKIQTYAPSANTWNTVAYPDFPGTLDTYLINTPNQLFAFSYCTANNRMVGYALSKTNPITINKVLNTVSQKLYLYRKN